MRFHLLGLAHLPTTPEIQTCAYTQKIVKLARMLKGLGHTILFYGVKGSQVECDEFIPVLSEAARRKCYGDYDWRKEWFPKFDGQDAAYMEFNANAIPEINRRKEERDFLLCSMGWYQKPIADAVGLMAAESGIGYEGVFAKFRVFESYAWMHYLYGKLGEVDGSWYDAVIPNYFDVAQFPMGRIVDEAQHRGDYFLYMGRIVKRKGIEVAAEVTQKLGARLLVVGQGSLDNESEGLHLSEFVNIEYRAAASPAERAELMGNAIALFAPTYYIEPFGGVAVEAQLCGTPVLTTDWGAFSETVQHGVTGYRCRTFEEFEWAAQHAHELDAQTIRAWAVGNYSMERVALMYQEYFERIQRLWGKGWYEPHPGRQELGWLTRYPAGEIQSALRA